MICNNEMAKFLLFDIVGKTEGEGLCASSLVLAYFVQGKHFKDAVLLAVTILFHVTFIGIWV